MLQVILSRWEPGLQKVHLTRLVQSSTGLPLAQANDRVDRFLAGEAIHLDLATESAANEFVAEAAKLGATARVIGERAAR